MGNEVGSSSAAAPRRRIAGLALSFTASAYWSMAGVGVGLAALAYWGLSLAPAQALLFGLGGVVIHWLSDFAHQFGHAIVARHVGYPMTGLRFWGIFSTSLWPQDEPPLPGRIHIQRALGGPIVSLLIGLIALIVAWFLGRDAVPGWWLAIVAAVDNLLILGLGAFLPLGFTDGSTILYWRKH